jgi:hypothetical protein
MNPIDDQLDRLFRSAAQARSAPVSEVPFGLETRALAAWRASQAAPTGFWDMTLLVRGLIVAGLIMAVSFLPVLNSTETTSDPFADYLQLTDSTVSSDEAQ